MFLGRSEELLYCRSNHKKNRFGGQYETEYRENNKKEPILA